MQTRKCEHSNRGLKTVVEINVKEKGGWEELRRWRVNYCAGRGGREMSSAKVLLNLASFTRLFPTRVTPLRSQTEEEYILTGYSKLCSY
jgi:hypothetical protein